MAQSPAFKVYSSTGEYLASCKYPEDAAALIAALGDGTTIRYKHGATVWTEGNEEFPASESYDFVAEKVLERL